MNRNRLVALKGSFDPAANSFFENGVDNCLTRDLMTCLGCSRWRCVRMKNVECE